MVRVISAFFIPSISFSLIYILLLPLSRNVAYNEAFWRTAQLHCPPKHCQFTTECHLLLSTLIGNYLNGWQRDACGTYALQSDEVTRAKGVQDISRAKERDLDRRGVITALIMTMKRWVKRVIYYGRCWRSPRKFGCSQVMLIHSVVSWMKSILPCAVYEIFSCPEMIKIWKFCVRLAPKLSDGEMRNKGTAKVKLK